jgi:hypothetical protein
VERSAEEKQKIGLDRLPPEAFANLCENLSGLHLRLCGDEGSMQRLTAIRMMYEPHAHALSDYMKMPLPLWVAEPKTKDAWKTVAALRFGADIHISDRATSVHLHDEEHGF